MPEVRFALPQVTFEKALKDAEAAGLKLPDYARLRFLGHIKDQPVARDTGQVREAGAVPAREHGALGPRILAEVQRLGWEKINIPHGVTKIAAALKVERRRVQGALGSLVASRKLRRSVYGYHPVAETPAQIGT